MANQQIPYFGQQSQNYDNECSSQHDVQGSITIMELQGEDIAEIFSHADSSCVVFRIHLESFSLLL